MLITLMCLLLVGLSGDTKPIAMQLRSISAVSLERQRATLQLQCISNSLGFTCSLCYYLFVIIIMIARQATYIKGHPIFTIFLFSNVHQFLNIENTTAIIHSKQLPTVNVYYNATDSIHIE